MATSVTSTSATLNGTVNPNGLATTYYFQYGPTTGYGSMTTTFAAGGGGATITYTQAAPTTGDATFAAAGNSQVFENSGDAVAAS